MNYYPIQLDEIDQWLVDNFDIIPGACSSTENLRYNTARMVAEALWPDKDHIADDSKKVELRNNSATTSQEAVNASQELEEAAEEWCKENHKGIALARDKKSHYLADGLDAFIAGANWQKEQDHDACYQCEKNYDTVFFRGEQHAIKMMKEDAIEASCFGGKEGEEHIVTFVVPYFRIKDLNLGDKVKVYIFKEQ